MDIFSPAVLDVAKTVIPALIGIISGAGYWNWKIKKAELDSKDKNEFKKALLDQVKELLEKVEALSDTKAELMGKIYKLEADLKIANQEIHSLNTLLKSNYHGK
jgi:peptidoglycan hydrolase CwlO-like protein